VSTPINPRRLLGVGVGLVGGGVAGPTGPGARAARDAVGVGQDVAAGVSNPPQAGLGIVEDPVELGASGQRFGVREPGADALLDLLGAQAAASQQRQAAGFDGVEGGQPAGVQLAARGHRCTARRGGGELDKAGIVERGPVG
jgi:hypothetical protein